MRGTPEMGEAVTFLVASGVPVCKEACVGVALDAPDAIGDAENEAAVPAHRRGTGVNGMTGHGRLGQLTGSIMRRR
jgi:hypothetical protein